MAVLAGGLSHEREVSLRSGRRLAAALRGVGARRARVGRRRARCSTGCATDPPDAVVDRAARRRGRERLGAGGARAARRAVRRHPGARACRRAWDKPTAKAELARAGLDTPDWVALPHTTFRELGAQAGARRDGRPARPAADAQAGPGRLGARRAGRAATRAELPAAMVGCLAYADTVLAERFVAGVEVAVTVVDGPDGPARAAGGRDRARRAASTTTPPATPPGADHLPLPGPARRRDGRRRWPTLALAAHQLLGLRDVSRTDADRRRRRSGPVPRGQRLARADRDLAAADRGRGGGLDLGDLYAGLVERAVAAVHVNTPCSPSRRSTPSSP